MVADPLTKGEADDDFILDRLMTSNCYNMHAAPEQQLAKKRKATMRSELKHEKKVSAGGRQAKMDIRDNEAEE